MLPKSLTLASRKHSPVPPEKAHQGSWKASPKPPGCPHRHFPQILTEAPRKGSPTLPAESHRPLPGRLTKRSRIDSPPPSRISSPADPEKSHLLGKFEFSRLERGGQCVWAPCRKQRRGMDIAASGTRLAAPYERRYFRREQAPARSWLLRSRDRLKCSAFLTVNIRNVPGGRRRPRHATSPRAGVPADATAAASS